MPLRVRVSRIIGVRIIGIISRVGSRLRFSADRYDGSSEVSARLTCDFSQQHCAFESKILSRAKREERVKIFHKMKITEVISRFDDKIGK